jgi:hypothetical protein
MLWVAKLVVFFTILCHVSDQETMASFGVAKWKLHIYIYGGVIYLS